MLLGFFSFRFLFFNSNLASISSMKFFSICLLFFIILFFSTTRWPLPRFLQLPCGHEYCKSCVEELRQKGVDKSCPLCRKPLPPGPDKLFDLGLACT